MTFPAAPCKLMKSIEKESQSRSFTSLQMVNTHTLAQKCLIELLMWNASFVSKKTSIKLARPNKGIGRICHRNPNHFLGAVSTNQSYTRSFYIDVFSRGPGWFWYQPSLWAVASRRWREKSAQTSHPDSILSFHSTIWNPHKLLFNQKDTHKLNYLKPTWATRFLLGILPKAMYSMDDESAESDDDTGGSDV